MSYREQIDYLDGKFEKKIANVIYQLCDLINIL